MAAPDRHPPARHVLFVCIRNSGRSQMSQAFFETAASGQGLSARSAGTAPAPKVDPTVVAVMAEIGYDLSGRRPSPLTGRLAEWADLVVTMGCGDACPFVPGARYIDWKLTDPAGCSPDEVREIRDELRKRVDSLVAELTPTHTSPAPEARG
jgi:arsenate reductase